MHSTIPVFVLCYVVSDYIFDSARNKFGNLMKRF